ncbi:hypothetical protein [Streptomyces albidoflavus]|uniref:hypothetical protein n=1 Tax=Streptomyces albidoflavus TaxID=1886 RepID=UPI003411DCCF
MTRGLCTAAVTLTPEEMQRLEELPGAANEVPEADGCSYSARHSGRHAFAVQVQELPGQETVHWWVIWDGPEQPDSTGYEIVTLEACDAERKGDVAGASTCRLPVHEGVHSWS